VDLAVEWRRFGLCVETQRVGQGLGQGFEVLEHDALVGQEAAHAFLVAKPAEPAAEDDAVESVDDSDDLVAELR
jgi:hypothetical protein